MPISPLPPLRPHATSATSPLTGLDITGDGSCHHQWSPLLGTLLFGVSCTGWCWQRNGGVTSMVAFAPGCPVPPPRLVPLSHAGSWDVMAGAGEVLSCRASPGWRKLCITPRPAQGAGIPGLWAGAGGPCPTGRPRIRADGGVAQVFPASTCPWPGLGEGCGGPRWEAEGRGGCLQPRSLFPSTCLGGSS